MRSAVFLDRDGTLIEDVGYLSSISQIKVLPRVVDGLKLLKSMGYLLIVVTNQSGVARGFFSEDFVQNVHDILGRLFKDNGVAIDAFYYCPHHPTEGFPPYNVNCDCRKPKTGMIKRAICEYDIDISNSWVIGDSLVDVQLARNAGCKGILLNRDDDLHSISKESFCDTSLYEAVKYDLFEGALYIKSDVSLRSH
ncbi:D-glycero-D-manno-heptose 1,7-bisphosphate phosphatase [Acetomicrobium thermoterrenum DSM 13490]|uniref:D,D-heptose 1,7-bisphosphate phosphatase n=1 Tax=Acetomicrobium thermoterrenum DSM 13490 TaxID=1120987 RepID=A0A1H3E9S1_9BACT|nr:HAD family hydrolase [Acetomicrobium thermoterrenum]SDX74664.1 D-glycero-D-manno-heptose 1,7-bisphosphate phosphatase [Acetomicrobium thermoterrenum DSM 13490]